MKRIFYILAFVLAASFTFTACSPGSKESSDETDSLETVMDEVSEPVEEVAVDTAAMETDSLATEMDTTTME